MARASASHLLRILHAVIPLFGMLFQQFFFVIAHLVFLLFDTVQQSVRASRLTTKLFALHYSQMKTGGKSSGMALTLSRCQG